MNAGSHICLLIMHMCNRLTGERHDNRGGPSPGGRDRVRLASQLHAGLLFRVPCDKVTAIAISAYIQG